MLNPFFQYLYCTVLYEKSNNLLPTFSRRAAGNYYTLYSIYFIYFLRTSNVGGGGELCCQTFSFVLFSLFSRPRAGLATVLSSFFGLATNTLNVRNNNNNNNNNSA